VQSIASEVAGLSSVIWNRGMADAEWSLAGGGTILENIRPRQRHHPLLYLSCTAAWVVVGLRVRVREGRRRALWQRPARKVAPRYPLGVVVGRVLA
jgi:hypothetical protein